MSRRTSFLPAALVALFALGLATAAHAACTYTTLTAGVATSTSTTPTTYQLAQANSFWTAVGVRPQSGSDWDITVYSSTAADPTCVTGALASSTNGGSALDFVVGDFNHNLVGTYYPYVHRFTGTGSATVQWDAGPDAIAANGSAVTGSMAASDVVRAWDVYMTVGTTYTFDFFPQSAAGAHLLLFRNTSGGTYWTGRSGASFDVTSSTTFVAPSTGFYGLVMSNDAGNSFSYSIGVTASACPIPTVLNNTTPVSIASPGGQVAFEPPFSDWYGCAVRATAGDWDLGLYNQPSGGASPTCLAGPLATSTYGGAVVDITLGDFNHSPRGWYFANPHVFSGSSPANVQFTSNGGVLTVNNDPIVRAMPATDLAHVYDVYLVSGHTYNMAFTPSASGLTALVFANTGGGAYFAGRGSAALATITGTTYTAPVSAWYGIAVVNDGAVSATYSLGFGDCALVTALTPGVATTTASTTNAYLSLTQTSSYWTAVAVRNTSVDWDLIANADNSVSPWPSCTSGLLATSAELPPRQDIIVGDFNYNTPGTYYLLAQQYTAGAVSPATVEWDSGSDYIQPNDNNIVSHATGPTDVVTCWDIYLTEGQTYEFAFVHGGSADLKLLLFRNTAAGTYWAGRSQAAFEATSSQTYVAPSSGYYGVVVVNDNGVADNYTLAVKTCDPIVALTPSAPTVGTYNPGSVLSFTQPNGFWTPIAVRAFTHGEDWDIAAYTSGTGGPIGTCANGILSSSNYVSGYTDFVIGNFNYDPVGTYYVNTTRYVGTGGAEVQYFSGSQTIALGDPHVVRTANSSFLVESWDTHLVSGQQYSIFFSHDPGLDVKVDLFAATGGVYWTGRSTALLEATHSTTFTAPVTGWYGLVVVNDGGTGLFNVGIATGVTAVDDAVRPDRDALNGVSPNPGRTGLHFDYALHEAGPVAFEVIDMAGRLVSRFEPASTSAGKWSAAWPGTGSSGQPLHPGVYFVRMRVGDRLVGTRKLTLLQ